MTGANAGYKATFKASSSVGGTKVRVAELQEITWKDSHEPFDATSHDSGGARERIGGITDMEASVDGLFVDDDASQVALFDSLNTREKIDVQLTPAGSGGVNVWSQSGFVSKWSIGGPVEGPAKFSSAIVGTGGASRLFPVVVALDTCTSTDGTAFGTDKPNIPPARTPDLGFGGWIVDRVNSGVDNGLDIQTNKAEQVNGHGAGQGGKYCTDDVLSDNFTYYADLEPNDNTTNLGLGFRYEENPADGSGNTFYWEQNADGWSVQTTPGTGGNVGINLVKRVAGTANTVVLVADGESIPFRLVLVVEGSNLDVYREPVDGGTRTALSLAVDLAQNLGGDTDDYNDSDHQRFGLVSASADNLSTFDNITVEQDR